MSGFEPQRRSNPEVLSSEKLCSQSFYYVTILELGLHTKLGRLPLTCKVAINSFEMVIEAMASLPV